MQLAPREYSRWLGTLTHEQLQAALDHFELGDLLAAEPATVGLFGQNVMIEATSGPCVLRGRPLVDFQFKKERFFAQRIHERTSVPVGWPYQLESSSEIFGWPFAVMPRLPGIQIGDTEVRESHTREEHRALARALGETLGLLHRLDWPHPAEYDPERDGIVALATGWADHVEQKVGDLLERCRGLSDATTADDVAWARGLVARDRGALEEPFDPCYVHHDYTEGNTVAERVGAGWRVSGVFDLHTSAFGDGEEDIVRSAAALAGSDLERSREFVAGYRKQRALRPGARERFRIYMLKDRLLHWEYGQRNKVWFSEGTRLRDFAEYFVDLDVL